MAGMDRRAEGADPEARAVSEVLVAAASAAVFISRAEPSACSATPSAPISPRVDKVDWEARAVEAVLVAAAAREPSVPPVLLLSTILEEPVETAAQVVPVVPEVTGPWGTTAAPGVRHTVGRYMSLMVVST